MKSRSSFAAPLFFLALVLSTTPALTQSLALLTTMAGGNAQSGNMFDLQATGSTPLIIKSFDVNMTGGPNNVEVYVVTANTTFVGNESIPANWTLLGTATNVTGLGGVTPTPLNLNLNRTINPGVRVGFYVVRNSGSLTYSNGVAVGNVLAADTLLTCYEGVGSVYAFGSVFTPRNFNGRIIYELAENILTLSQSGPMVGDLTIGLSMLSPTAYEGWTLFSSYTILPVGSGPILGMWPDSLTFSLLSYPYFPGSPFHFHTNDTGVFAQSPFYAPPGSVSGLSGFTFDFVCVFLKTDASYSSRSNLVRFNFQ